MTIDPTAVEHVFSTFGLPVPAYRIGDTVYLADIDYSYEPGTCPDCLGAKVWELTTPAGETLQAECPRCTHRYSHDNTYQVQLFRPKVTAYAVTGIEIRADGHRPPYVSYQLPQRLSASESQCYRTEAEAMAAAEAQSEKRKGDADRARYMNEQRIVVGLKYSDLRIRQIQAQLDKAKARVDGFHKQTREMAEFSHIKDPDSRYGGRLTDGQVKAVLRELFSRCEENWPVEGDEE